MTPTFNLDACSLKILQEFKDKKTEFEQVAAEVKNLLEQVLSGSGKISSKLEGRLKAKELEGAGLHLASIEYRVKTEYSLAEKLERKGNKYGSLADITDIIGLRVITFYTDDVDKVASAIEKLFEIDWDNSVDKRKLLQIDSFGYLSRHYICSLKDYPHKFEIQLRTVLQHAWANMDHDTGYKSGVEIPQRYLRSMNRLAGMLELIDDEFSRMRSEITDYRRSIRNLVSSGKLDEVPLDGDTFKSYLDLKPFDNLNRHIASMNQAEIQPVSLMQYLPIFKGIGCKTLGDVNRIIKKYSDAAYQIASYQMGLTDLDVISASLGPQNLCIAYILKNDGGKADMRFLYELINGTQNGSDVWAEMIIEQARDLPFMNQ